MIRASETPIPISAQVAGHKNGWKLVRIVFEDRAEGEARTTAGFSDSNGTWLFSTQAVPSGTYGGEGTGQRTIEVYAPKEAANVQLQAAWPPPDPTQPVPGDISGYSAMIPITK